MRILYDFAVPGQRAPTLIVLLPGALQQPEELVQAGFVAAVRARGLPIDLALVDLELHFIGEVTDGTALQRLHLELMQQLPAYDQLWLGGISIGAFLAMAYAQAHPGRLNGLCLLAPYPGNRMQTGAIIAAGGLGAWTAACAADDLECQVWQWLKNHSEQDAAAPHIHLGYGLQDRFAQGQQLLGAALAAHNVDAIDGIHDWPAWQQLWNNFLERQPHVLASP